MSDNKPEDKKPETSKQGAETPAVEQPAVEKQAQKLSIANGATLNGQYPHGVSWNANLTATDLVELFDDSVKKYADKPCIDFFGRELTYKQVGDMVNRAAKGFQKQGVKQGSKVGLCMPNSPYYPVMMFAALKAGATVVNYNPLYDEEKLEKLIDNSGTDVMVMLDLKEAAGSPYYQKIMDLKNSGKLGKVVVCPMGGVMPTALGWGYRLTKRKWFATWGKNVVSFGKLTNNDGKVEKPAINKDDLAVLQFTGGTSGTPKGAMLTHFNLAVNADQIVEFYGKSSAKKASKFLMEDGKETILGALPYFHVFGMQIGMITPLKLGAKIAIVADPKDRKGLGLIETIARTKVTILPAVPQLFQAISKNPELSKHDLSSLKLAVSGGAPLPAHVKDDFEKATGCTIKQGFGLSETAPVASAEPYDSSDPMSIGTPVSHTEYTIRDPEDSTKILPQGQEGELCIKGPQVMKGYFNMEAENKKIFTNDGAFRTGDVAVMKENGNFKITDRLSRMILVNGFNVYPNQIEKAISKHTSVAECTVVKVPNKSSGEAAKAFVFYDPAATDKPTPAEIKKFLEDVVEMNPTEVPLYFEVSPKPLPRTDVGKLDYKTLEKQEAARHEAEGEKAYKDWHKERFTSAPPAAKQAPTEAKPPKPGQ